MHACKITIQKLKFKHQILVEYSYIELYNAWLVLCFLTKWCIQRILKKKEIEL